MGKSYHHVSKSTLIPKSCHLFTSSICIRQNTFRHGRDNKLHVWERVQEPVASASIRLGGSAALPGLQTPTLRYSMDVNALNYCRFSLLHYPSSAKSGEALIALPNLVESSLVRITK